MVIVVFTLRILICELNIATCKTSCVHLSYFDPPMCDLHATGVSEISNK